MAAAGLEAVGGLRGGPPAPQAAPGTVEQLVLELTDPATRENALLELSKKREAFPELAPYLWHSFGTVSALLQVRPSPPPPRASPPPPPGSPVGAAQRSEACRGAPVGASAPGDDRRAAGAGGLPPLLAPEGLPAG